MPTSLFGRLGGDKPYQYRGQTRQTPFGSRYPPITRAPTPAPTPAPGLQSAGQGPLNLGAPWLNQLYHQGVVPAYELYNRIFPPRQQYDVTPGAPYTTYSGNPGFWGQLGQNAPVAAIGAQGNPLGHFGQAAGALWGTPTAAQSIPVPPVPGAVSADPFLGGVYTPAAGGASVGAQAQVGGALVDRSGAQRLTQTRQTLTGEGATTPGGRVEPKYATAPPGVDAGWYKQFQVEHDGEKPEDFYARTGEGLDEALGDREWGNRFAQMMGRPPSEYDWEEHWYSTRGYGRPQGDPGAGWRRKSRRGKTDVDEKRAPLYVPERTSWRL